MTSHEQTTTDMTHSIDDLSSTIDSLPEIEECTLLKKQCNELTMQKQAIETRSDMLLVESRRLIEQKDNEFVKYEQVIDELKDENTQLKLRIKELEDWNGDFQENDSFSSKQDHSTLQLNIDLLTSRNSQLESDLQHLQLQQRNNQLALERLDEYEETISQLQEELDQFRSNKKISTLEQQILELNEEIQSLENANHQLQQQLFQTTPGSPPSRNSSENLSSLNSLYDQFVTLLPSEFTLSDNIPDRFTELFEQFSSYIGTFSIIQEELDSLKQILNEKQDESEKLRTHLAETTDRLTQLQEEQSLYNKDKSYESDEDELEEILGFQQRAPSMNSLLSITPGEKQQLIAQNEILSTLLNEKEQELIELQQAEKTRDDLNKTLDILRFNLQQIELEKEVKQVELNDIRNILDEKLRENSSLKKEKMFFIEKLAQFERERQEQQSTIQLSSDRSTETEQLLELYNELNTKHSQLQIDYESIQSLIQQKNEAYLQCQNELNTYQNLLYHQKKKSDDIDLLRSTLNEREIQLQQLIDQEKQWVNKQSEYESKLKFFEESNLKLLTNQKTFEQIQLDLKRITHERDLAIVEKKQCENQMELNQEKLLQSEERERKLTTLRDQLNTKISAVEIEYAKLEDTNLSLNEQIKYLQNNLGHIQQDRDCRLHEQLVQYQDSLREQISITAQLTNENNELRQRFDDEINNLQREIDLKTKQIIESNENFQAANNSRVEKQLVKNILLSYFHTPINKQQEVVPLIGALVGFTQEEYQKAMNAIANNYQNNTGGTSWLTSWLSMTPSKPKTEPELSNKSFAELLIQYVDQQSTDNNLQQPMLTLSTDNSSESTSDNPTQSIV